jgi:hypothetical protein
LLRLALDKLSAFSYSPINPDINKILDAKERQDHLELSGPLARFGTGVAPGEDGALRVLRR